MTGIEFDPTLPGAWEEDTRVDLVPAGALAPARTLPVVPGWLEDVATETRGLLEAEVARF